MRAPLNLLSSQSNRRPRTKLRPRLLFPSKRASQRNRRAAHCSGGAQLQAAADQRCRDLPGVSSFIVGLPRLAAHKREGSSKSQQLVEPKGSADTSRTRKLRHQQFVRENTQAINCRGFYSQNDGTECDRLTCVTTRQRKLSRSEVAFRPYKHQYASRTITMFARIGFQNSF